MTKRAEELYGSVIVTTPDDVDFSWKVIIHVGGKGSCLAFLRPLWWRNSYKTHEGAVRAARRVMKILGIEPRKSV